MYLNSWKDGSSMLNRWSMLFENLSSMLALNANSDDLNLIWFWNVVV